MSGRVMHPLDRKLLRDVRRLWGQLTAAGVVLAAGVSVLVLSQFLIATLSRTLDAYYERENFADVFAHARRAPKLVGDDIRAIPGVRDVSLRIRETVRLDIPELVEPASATIVSVPRYGEPAVNGLFMTDGRYVEPGRHNEALISGEFAEARGIKPGDMLTAVINGRKRDLEIVGVAQSPEFLYAIAPGELLPLRDRYGILWMAEDALERAFDLDGAFNDVAITLTRDASEADVIDRLDDILDPYGGVGAYGRKDHVSAAFIQSELDQNRSMARIMPPIFLLTAAFMIHVALGRLIDTEREQVGLMKAFGYTDGDIAWHYLKLAMVPGVFGGLAGCALGSWSGHALSRTYAYFYNFPYMIVDAPASVYATGMLIALGASASGALLAVRAAARLDPAVAMRPQPPARFDKGWIDILGVIKALSPPTRIIVRNMVRRPLRSGLTTLGVAAGCGTMIAGSFMFDSMAWLIETQFEEVQRQDVVLSFPIERPASILNDVAHLPGVREVEGVRLVGVRLRHGPRSELSSLTGLGAAPELYRPLDAERRPIAAPPAGVMMSRHLADKLALHLGEDVTVEVLEGRRPTLRLPVTALVDDYIGSAVYMRREALNRALREGRAVNAAYVLLDHVRYDSFFAAAKESPVIQAVGLRNVTIEEFRRTFEQNAGIYTGILFLFAGSICFGVVYNAARISLSERGRELASLRVLGYTRAEASYVLLGELALLTLLALPLGGVFGYFNALAMMTMFDADLVRPPLILTPQRFAVAMVATALFAVVSGMIVRRRIDKLDLIAVLKTRE